MGHHYLVSYLNAKDEVIQSAGVTMPELTHYGFDGLHGYTKANKLYRRELMKRAKAAVGITHLRGITSVYEDGVYHFKPSKLDTLLAVVWVSP